MNAARPYLGEASIRILFLMFSGEPSDLAISGAHGSGTLEPIQYSRQIRNNQHNHPLHPIHLPTKHWEHIIRITHIPLLQTE
ncbi:hypothetical protein FQZ97_866610 [compost metagenome]